MHLFLSKKSIIQDFEAAQIKTLMYGLKMVSRINRSDAISMCRQKIDKWNCLKMIFQWYSQINADIADVTNVLTHPLPFSW